jgi:hypothetical protein
VRRELRIQLLLTGALPPPGAVRLQDQQPFGPAAQP